MKREPTPISAARLRAGLSQHDLAVRVGVSRGWLAVIERAPTLADRATLARVAAVLGVPVSRLMLSARRPGVTGIIG